MISRISGVVACAPTTLCAAVDFLCLIVREFPHLDRAVYKSLPFLEYTSPDKDLGLALKTFSLLKNLCRQPEICVHVFPRTIALFSLSQQTWKGRSRGMR